MFFIFFSGLCAVAPPSALSSAAPPAASSASVVSASVVSASVVCTGANTSTCTLRAFAAEGWLARAQFSPTVNVTGWGRLEVETRSGAPDGLAAFAAGYVEAALTTDLISFVWQNIGPTPEKAVMSFIEANTQWVEAQVRSATVREDASESATYWAAAKLVYDQLDGLAAGYDAHRGVLRPLSRTQLMLLGMTVELGDIAQAVDPSARPRYDKMTPEELEAWAFDHSHCSAMIKVTADLGELFASHNTWTGYSDMLRLWKIYTFPFSTSKAHTVSFSGYPGKIAGIDDYYLTSQRLTVIETTNGVYNTSLFDAVTPQTVPYWVRVTLATRGATTAQEWHQLFYKYNSGTYNNRTLRALVSNHGRAAPALAMSMR